tara:strand:+ start:297 stop:779 length:483 start_codon:yes stop_codon:yes gene_type:complete
MTTEKIKPNNNWYKCGETNTTSIQAYNRYLDQNNNPIKDGNFTIDMGWTVFDHWGELKIDIFDQDTNNSHQVTIKTTLDQVVNIKPTKLAFYIKDKDKKNYKHSVNMGRFHFYDDKKNKLFDESEVKKVKKLINHYDSNSFDENLKQVDIEELIKEKEGK